MWGMSEVPEDGAQFFETTGCCLQATTASMLEYVVKVLRTLLFRLAVQSLQLVNGMQVCKDKVRLWAWVTPA